MRECPSCYGFGMREFARATYRQCENCAGHGFIYEKLNGQSRKMSFGEACFSTAVGLIVSMIANAIVFPLFGFHVSLIQNLWISLIYTAISIGRGYCVRRLFEAWR